MGITETIKPPIYKVARKIQDILPPAINELGHSSDTRHSLSTLHTPRPRRPITRLSVGHIPSSPKSISSRLMCCLYVTRCVSLNSPPSVILRSTRPARYVGSVNVKFEIGGMAVFCSGNHRVESKRNAANGATRNVWCLSPEGMIALLNFENRDWLSSHGGRRNSRAVSRVVRFTPKSGFACTSSSSFVVGLRMSAPSMYNEGGYVFHQ